MKAKFHRFCYFYITIINFGFKNYSYGEEKIFYL
jgi:hypothetical protein